MYNIQFIFINIYFRVHDNAADQCDNQERRTCDSKHFDSTVLMDEPYQYHSKYYTDDRDSKKRASEIHRMTSILPVL